MLWEHRGHGDHRSPGPLRHRGRAAPRPCLVARGELPVRRPDLPPRQPAPAPAAGARPDQAPPAGPLGHDPGAQPDLRPPQPRDPCPRPRRDLRVRSGPRRSGHGGQHLHGGHLQRGLPPRRPGRGGHAQAVPPVLVPRRHPQPRRPGDARVDQRGRRAGLLAGPRLRRRVRQPRPGGGVRDRRRRGRDRLAGRVVALEQVPQPGHRRRRAADPPPQRLQDRQPHRARPHPARRAGPPVRGLRPHGPRRGGGRPRGRPPRPGRHARRGPGRDRGRPAGVAGRRGHHPAPLAHDRAAHAQGLDGPQGGGRRAGGGHLPLPPGAPVRPGRQPRAPAPAGGVAALLRARRAVRRHRAPPARDRRAGPRGRPAHGRQPPRQRRPADPPPGPARLPGLRGARRPPRRVQLRAHPGHGRLAAGRGGPQPGDFPDHGAGRDRVRTAWAPCWR